MGRLALVISIVIAASMQSASAHPGPRVWVNVEGGKITTYGRALSRILAVAPEIAPGVPADGLVL